MGGVSHLESGMEKKVDGGTRDIYTRLGFVRITRDL